MWFVPCAGPKRWLRLTRLRSRLFADIKPGGGVGVLPAGPRIFVAGQASPDTDLVKATRKTLEELNETLKFLDLGRTRVVRLKAFMQPMTVESVALVERAVAEFFSGADVPPMSVVAWTSGRDVPIEIEMVVAGQGAVGPPAEYLTPPFLKVSPLYSRGGSRRLRFADLYVRILWSAPRRAARVEVESIFDTMGAILAETGCDMRHLVKATYYVSDEVVSRALNEVRPRYYDPKRPPAASKAFVAGVGVSRASDCGGYDWGSRGELSGTGASPRCDVWSPTRGSASSGMSLEVGSRRRAGQPNQRLNTRSFFKQLRSHLLMSLKLAGVHPLTGFRCIRLEIGDYVREVGRSRPRQEGSKT